MPNAKKWIEIGSRGSTERLLCLSEQLSAQGHANEFEFVEVSTEEEFQNQLESRWKSLDGIRVTPDFSEKCLKVYPNHSVEMAQLGAADCFIFDQGAWWPRSILYTGLLEVFATQGENFNFDSSAIVVGAEGAAKVAVAVLFREGFKRFGLTDLDEGLAKECLRDLRRVYFGAEFEFIPKDELILLPGLYGVIVNTVSSERKKELHDELAYFNFFMPNGVAVDLVLSSKNTELLSEANEIGATTISGIEIAATSDAVWCQWAFGLELKKSEYIERLKRKFQSKV